MLAIYKRELKSYFHSMTGCVFIAFLVMFTGIYFMAYNLNAGYPYFSYTLSGSLIVFLVGIPLLTMRSFSEERKTKTDQLLLTAPVSLTKVVLGKYFAMVTVLAVPNVIFCLFPLLIKLQGTAYLLVDYSSIAARATAIRVLRPPRRRRAGDRRHGGGHCFVAITEDRKSVV